MKKSSLFLVLISLLFSFSCKSKKDTVTLMLEWSPNTRHIGFYVAKDKGFFEEEGLNVRILESESGVVERTLNSKQADYGVSYMSEVMSANNNGLDVFAIAALCQTDLSGLAVNSTNVKTLKDLEGKSYGSWGGAHEIAQLERLFAEHGADFSKVNVINAGGPGVLPFGTDSPNAPDFINTFEDWAYIEVKLKNENVKFFPIRDLMKREISYSPVLITYRDKVKNNKEEALAFVRAVEKGYIYAHENPNEAVDIFIKNVPEYSEEFIGESLGVLSPHWFNKENVWGKMSLDVWKYKAVDWATETLVKEGYDATPLVSDIGLN